MATTDKYHPPKPRKAHKDETRTENILRRLEEHEELAFELKRMNLTSMFEDARLLIEDYQFTVDILREKVNQLKNSDLYHD